MIKALVKALASFSLLAGLFRPAEYEKISPSDIIPQSAIQHSGNKIIIDLDSVLITGLTRLPEVWIPHIPDTGSMDPVMDSEHNNILIRGQNDADQIVIVDWLFNQPPGNIAVYRTARIYAIHRVIAKGDDELGDYLIFKGDNNRIEDPDLVRREDVRYISLGTIY